MELNGQVLTPSERSVYTMQEAREALNHTVVEFVVACGHDISSYSLQHRGRLLSLEEYIPDSSQQLVSRINAQGSRIVCLSLFADCGDPSVAAIASSVIVGRVEAQLLTAFRGRTVSALRLPGMFRCQQTSNCMRGLPFASAASPPTVPWLLEMQTAW